MTTSAMAALLARLRTPRHVHEWEALGYGGCGWYSIQCVTCGEKDIA